MFLVMIRWREWSSVVAGFVDTRSTCFEEVWDLGCFLRIQLGYQIEKWGVSDPTVLAVLLILMCTIATLLVPDISSDYTEAFVWFLNDFDPNFICLILFLCFPPMLKVSNQHLSKYEFYNEELIYCRPSPTCIKNEDRQFIDSDFQQQIQLILNIN